MKYTGPRERILVKHLNDADLFDDINSTDTPKTGIDRYADTILHERRHVQQVLEHNALMPFDVSVGGARIGWSFTDNGSPIRRTKTNIADLKYNHFRPGPDGQPGLAGFDDNFDHLIDNTLEYVAGPPDPLIANDVGSAVSDDIDLDRDGDLISHLAPTDPDPSPTVFNDNIEPPAKAAETNPQDNYREHDWANPGKQHGPDLPARNLDGEINSYVD